MTDKHTLVGEYLIRKGGYFYRPNSQGYTSSPLEAGIYTLDQAIRETHPNGPDGDRDGLTYHHRSDFPEIVDATNMANRITALEAEKVLLVSENARLREAIARLTNSINIVGSPYHRAQQALDDLVSEVKQTARATLAKAHQSDEGE